MIIEHITEQTKGLGWIVGDGAQISLWSSPWLSLISPQAPMGPPNRGDTNIKVCDLINQETMSWDLDKIRNLLPHYEGNIKQISLSFFKRKDEQVWLPDKSGFYTTKTGYNCIKTSSSLLHDESFNWWNTIWKLDTAPKLKKFLWKVKNHALPFGANLAMRGVITDLRYKRCGEFEDELHVLLLCPFALSVWELIPACLKPQASEIKELKELLTKAKEMKNLPPTGVVTCLYPWTMWHLWKTRNFLLFENKTFTAKEVVSKIVFDTRAWQEAQSQDRHNLQAQPYQISTFRLEPDAIFGFVDVAWLDTSLNSGAGWVFKTQGSDTLFQGSSSFQSVPSALVVEALALKAAVVATRFLGIHESDTSLGFQNIDQPRQ